MDELTEGPESSNVGEDLLDVHAYYPIGDLLDSVHDDIISSTNG